MARIARARRGTMPLMSAPRFIVLGVALLVFAGCDAGPRAGRGSIEAPSLLGGPGYAPLPLDEQTRARYEANLDDARRAYDADPTSEDAAVWLGRRTAYLGRYREAIDLYTRALRDHPDSVKLLRHRGHRFITIRRFDAAVADLSRAGELIRTKNIPDEIEPDGLPNARNEPRSTLHDNVAYHLALAHFLRGEFARAADEWRGGLERATPNDDMRVAYAYWLFIAEHRAGRPDAAQRVLADLESNWPADIIENHAYDRLLRVFAGRMTSDEALAAAPQGTTDQATTLAGLGMFAFIRGDQVEARRLWSDCVHTGQWPSFGFIAAEADLARATSIGRTGAAPENRTTEERLREIQRERQRYR